MQVGRNEASAVLAGKVVLITEDEWLVAYDMDRTLSECGAKVLVASTVDEALPLAERPDLSAAVLDMLLGDQTAAPICFRLAERGIPFVFSTGLTPVDEEWKHATVLDKPCAPDVLVKAVVGLVSKN